MEPQSNAAEVLGELIKRLQFFSASDKKYYVTTYRLKYKTARFFFTDKIEQVILRSSIIYNKIHPYT